MQSPAHMDFSCLFLIVFYIHINKNTNVIAFNYVFRKVFQEQIDFIVSRDHFGHQTDKNKNILDFTTYRWCNSSKETLVEIRFVLVPSVVTSL